MSRVTTTASPSIDGASSTEPWPLGFWERTLVCFASSSAALELPNPLYPLTLANTAMNLPSA